MPGSEKHTNDRNTVRELERQVTLYIADLEKYKAIFNDAPLGIFRATIGGKYIEANQTLTRLLGYSSPSELINNVKDISRQIYARSRERKKLISDLLKGASVICHETTFRKKDGTEFPVSITLKMMYGQDGNPLYMSGIVEDISLRIKTQENLVYEKNQLRVLIDHLPDYIYLKDPDENFIVVNKAFAGLLNIRNPETLSGKNSHDFSDGFVLNLLKDDKEILKKGKAVFNKEESGESSGGKMLYAYTSKIPLKNDKGMVMGLIGIGRNFTELKLAQQIISSSQANLNAVLESTKSSIWSLDRDFTLITANVPFLRFFNTFFRKKIKAGDNFLAFLPDKQKSKWKKIHKRAFKGEHWVLEEHYELNEKPVYFEISVNPIVGDDQKITGITLFATDVSDRKLAGDALRESEEHFRQLAENTNDAFILYDKNSILYANPAFEKIYGRSVKELLHDPSILKESVYSEDKNSYLKNAKRKLSRYRHAKGFQFRIVRADGQVRSLWSRSFPVLNDHAKIYRHISVISDITDQIELQQVISKSKTQQKGILDNIPYLAWLKDSEGKYIMVNDPFAEFMNLDPVDIIGKSDFDLFPEEMAKKYQCDDEEVMKSGKRLLFEEFENTPSGTRWIEIFKTPIFNDDGKLIGITGISRDISQRKTMEEKLRQREEHFSALLQNSSDAISILDKDGMIIFENSPKNKINDFYRNELLGKSIFDTLHADEIPAFKDLIRDLLTKPGKQIKKEYRSLHKNKKWVYVESIFSNQINNKAINGIIVNSRDISERKMAELKERVYHDNLIFLSNSALDLLGLSLNKDIYRYIADKLQLFLEDALVVVSSFREEKKCFQIENYSCPPGAGQIILDIIGKDITGFTFSYNRKFFDLKNAGMVTHVKNNFDVLHLKDVDYLLLVKALETLNVHKVYNISLARHNKLLGNITILTLNKTIIKFKHIIETFVHQVSVALQRSQLEAELVKAKEKAEESDKLKTAFLTNMSHEIRTPMNGILGFAEMLNDDNISLGNKKKYLEIIHNSGKMLINLIDDIIDFAKIEAGQINISYQDFSLNKLMSQVYSSFLSESFKKEKSEVKLLLNVDSPNGNIFIHADPYRLRQILTNLVGNAFKFTENGFIELGCRIQKNKLMFYVKDTGIGIPSDKLEVIFDRFIQADNSSTRKYGGSGLGLAISKGFVEIMGGKMWAESNPGEGSVFYFTIPYVPAKNPVEEEKSSQKRSHKNYIWENRTFLIAEDDKFSYKFLESFLKQTRANVLHASDGKEAVEICRSNHNIDLILMDIQMPEMNGLQATEEIKRFNRFVPVIAQTANAIMEEKQKCYDAGCDDFITKPVNINELYSKIDKWLALKNNPCE